MQKDVLTNAGCEKLFDDQLSGGKLERPGLEAAIEYACEGDVIIVWRLDKLGHSLKDLITLIARFEEKKINRKRLNEALEIVKIVCESGVDLTKPNAQGLTPLQIAGFTKDPEKITYNQTQISAKILSNLGIFETTSLERKSSVAENEVSSDAKKLL